MNVRQVSVFMESRPGHMKRLLDDIHAAGLSIRGYSAADTGDYGVVRFVVDDPEKAEAVLREHGHAVRLTEILALRLTDKPGELARVIGYLSDAGMNVVYSYSLSVTDVAIGVEAVDRAAEILREHHVDLLTQEDLA